MSAAVTGASGFVGRALVRSLLADGVPTRALVRRRAAREALESLGASTHWGDLTLPYSCKGLARAGDVVYHSAARVDMVGSWKQFERATIDGTRCLLQAVLPAKPKRFVYVSSGAVYGCDLDPAGNCADRSPTNPPRHHFYGRAKIAAERIVREACERAGCEWSIVRLGFLYGVGNRALTDHLAPKFAKRQLVFVGSGDNRIATLYIDDAVSALRAAGEHPAAASRIYDAASNEVVTQRQFMDATADALGLPRIRRSLRVTFLMGVARLAETGSAWFGAPSPLTRAMIDLMSGDQALDSTALRRELGWQPQVAFEEGMRRIRESREAAGKDIRHP